MTGIETGLLIGAIGGTGLNFAGQLMGASAQADAAQRAAQLKRIQADELEKRELVNEGIIRENSARMENQYSTAFAATGGGGGLGGVLEIRRQTERNIMNAREDSQFKEYMLRQGADIESQLASDAMTASYITGAGSVLGLGAKFYGIYGKYSGQQELPKVTT
jgi:hypothetical protein